MLTYLVAVVAAQSADFASVFEQHGLEFRTCVMASAASMATLPDAPDAIVGKAFQQCSEKRAVIEADIKGFYAASHKEETGATVVPIAMQKIDAGVKALALKSIDDVRKPGNSSAQH